MSTTTLRTPSSASLSIARRFLWKEYRLLRGLWLAVAAIMVAMQGASALLAAPGTNLAAWMFGSALAAATLYAVGAAAVSFAVEHEEETYGFLTGLPTTWQPMFAGKLLMATLSAAALAALLMLTGWGCAGWPSRTASRWPTPHEMALVSGLLGVAVVEALAWGVFFSLLVKRPLVAALATLVVGSLAIHVAVNATSRSYVASLSLEPYTVAIPLRLAMVSAVFGGSIVLARRWLTLDARHRPLSGTGLWAGLLERTPPVSRVAAWPWSTTAAGRPYSRRRMLLRLLWQTWRESSGMLILSFGVAAALVLGFSLVGTGLFGGWPAATIGAVTVFFLPALYGAMVFHADQRRAGYRFLAEHAARPRYIWFARHAVWLGTLLVLWTVFMLVVALLVAYGFKLGAEQFLMYSQWRYTPVDAVRYRMQSATSYVVDGLTLGWIGALSAYGIGQLGSMLLRSEILAAFLASVAAIVLVAWAAVLMLWGLSGWWFLLPLALATMLATWLRAPDWITDRHLPRSWAKPVLAVAAPLLLFSVMLPAARLSQIPADQHTKTLAALKPKLNSYRAGDTPEARQTADMYLHATRIPRQREFEAFNAVLPHVIDASERPECRFSFDPSAYTQSQYRRWQFDDPTYRRLIILLDSLMPWQIESTEAFDRSRAALRMCAHLRSGQPTLVFQQELRRERAILGRVARWAHMRDRTSGELHDAIDELQAHFQSLPDPTEALLADRDNIREVLLEKALPITLNDATLNFVSYLPYLANRFSWERERAQRALDVVTLCNVVQISELPQRSNLLRPRDYSAGVDWPEKWAIQWPAAATSYLLTMEYRARVPLHEFYRELWDTETHRRATLLHVALAAYRQDHGRYPEALVDLVPDYLPSERLDPYADPRKPSAGQSFQYAATGLDLPLRRWPYNDSERVEPGTAVFWSVGPEDLRLTRRFVEHIRRDDKDPNAEPVSSWEQVYVLTRDDRDWHSEPALTFPLPR